MKNLLVEYNVIQYGKELLAEAADITKPLVLKNVLLQRAEAKNQNGRVYPKEAVVNLKNVCCNVTELWFEGQDVRGNIEVLSTPSGNIVRELIKNNIRLGVSSRGMGSVRQMGESTVEVQDDFSLICFDIVSNPSTHGAFINESKKEQIVTPYSRIDSLVYDFLSEIK